MARFTQLPGSARRYLDNVTGQEISRRARDEILRGGTTNEQLAAINRAQNPTLAASRPAKGRKSILKLGDAERELIAQARIEDAMQRRVIAEDKRKQRELERLLNKRAQKKHIRRRKITGALLQPGRLGRRVPFETYEDYVQMFKEAKAGGKVKFYGLGVQGYHENTGQELDITVFPLRTLTNPVSRDEFEGRMEEEIENRPYFIFSNYWMHLAFSKEYAAKRATKARPRKRR